MKLSARNQLKGKIIDMMKGATTSHVRIEIAGGVIVRHRLPTKPSLILISRRAMMPGRSSRLPT
jgi:hypothetical protein